MKKFLFMSIVILLLLLPLCVNAQTSGSCGDAATWTRSGDTLTISGTGAVSSAPTCNAESIINIIIGDEITSIESYVFSGFTNLAYIDISPSVSYISPLAFYCCDSLENIKVSGDNSFYTSLDGHLFNEDTSMLIRYAPGKTDTIYEVPESLTAIGEYAFSGCTNLIYIILHNIEYINYAAFKDCTSLEAIDIPDTVTVLTDSLFSGCSNLSNVTLGNSISSIGHNVFENCTSLQTLELPNTVQSIGDFAFFHCENLESIYLGTSLTSIGSCAFEGCGKLSSIPFPDTLKSIDKQAFMYCRSLTEINIAQGLSYIGQGAFSCCTNSSFNVSSGNQYFSSFEGHLFNKDRTELVSYAKGKADAAYTIPDTVTTIIPYAFNGCEMLEEITFPDSLTAIGSYAFAGINSLKSITIPGSVEIINDFAFASCDSLEQVEICEGVEIIGESVFSSQKLERVFIPESITHIGDFAFNTYSVSFCRLFYTGSSSEWNNVIIGNDIYNKDCAELYYGYTGKTVSDGIEYYLFSGSALLQRAVDLQMKNAVIREYVEGCRVQEIADNAFAECVFIEKTLYSGDSGVWNKLILYTEGNDAILNEVHFGCTGSTVIRNIEYLLFDGYAKVYGPSSSVSGRIELEGTVNSLPVISIMDEAFASCTEITSVKIPENVTLIGQSSFFCCEALTTLILPASLEIVDSDAFSSCNKLENIAYCSTEENWGNVYIWEGSSYLTNADFYYECLDIITDESAEYLVYADHAVVNGVVPRFDTDVLVAYSVGGVPVTKIADRAFYQDHIESITLPDSLTYIGEYAFYGCPWLEEITIPSSVTTIGAHAFDACYLLDSVNFLGSVSKIGSAAFYNCPNITRVYLKSADSFANVIFESKMSNPLNSGASLYINRALAENLVFSDNISLISTYAFYGCRTIKSLTLPKTVSYICDNAFEYCDNIETVFYEGAEGLGIGSNNGALSSAEIFYNCLGTKVIDDTEYLIFNDHAAVYKGNLTSSEVTVTASIDDVSVTEIMDSAFKNAALTKITLPGSIKLIESNVFSGCTNLKSIALPDGVTAIKAGTFSGCTKLETINIPSTVTSVNNAFSGCISLKQLEFTNDAVYFQASFSGCESLEKIVLPPNLVSIDQAMFYGCSKLSDIVIPEGVEIICPEAFYGCESLSTITIPKSTSTIESRAFYGCTNLMEINVDESNEYFSAVDSNLFTKDKTNLVLYAAGKTDSLYVIPETVITIGEYAFSGCTLTQLTVPVSLQYVFSNAFEGCSSLTDVFYNDTLDKWKNISVDSSNDALLNANLHYIIPVTGVALDNAAISLCMGGSIALIATVLPLDATNKKIIWTSSDESIAAVDEYGVVSAHKSGTVTITAKTEDGGFKASCTVSVIISVESIVLDESTLLLNKGSSHALTATVFPLDATNKKIIWTSSDESIAAVDEYGVVTAVGGGTATITAETEDGNKSDECSVTVEIPVTGVYLNPSSLKLDVGDTAVVVATVLPTDATNKKIIWTSSDENVAAVDEYGVVTAIKSGSATITAETEDGGYTDSTEVFIPVYATGITINKEFLSLDSGFTEVLSATVIPDNTTDKTVLWTSSDIKVATVDRYGAVTAISSGTATITASSADGKYTASCTVTVANTLYSGSMGTNQKWSLNENGTLTISGTGAMPGSITHINAPWYQYISNIKSIVTGEGITAVNWDSIQICVNASEIYISSTLTGIDESSFDNLMISKITVSEDNPQYSTQYNVLFNKNKTELIYYAPKKTNVNYKIPEGVERICNYAFEGCSILKELSIPASVNSIEPEALIDNALELIQVDEANEHYSSLNGVLFDKDKTVLIRYVSDHTDTSYIVPGSVETIAANAFIFSHWLNEIVLPIGLKSIEEYAFGECDNLKSIDIPNTVTSIGTGAFCYCIYLESVSLPPNISSIENGVFLGCENLESIFIPHTVTSIGYRAFADCGRLRKIVMYGSMRHLGSSAFHNCGDITITYIGTEEDYSTIILDENNENFSAFPVYYEDDYSIASTGITLNKTSASIETGDSIHLIAAIIPSNATNTGISWRSSDESVATVSKDGTVTAVSEGNVTITALSDDGGYTATCTVSVKRPLPPTLSDCQITDKITFTASIDSTKEVNGKFFAVLYQNHKPVEIKPYTASNKVNMSFDSINADLIKVFWWKDGTIDPISGFASIDIAKTI